MPHVTLTSQKVSHMIQRIWKLVRHMGHVNPIKWKIMEGKPNHLARREKPIGSGHKLLRHMTMHEFGGDKW